MHCIIDDSARISLLYALARWFLANGQLTIQRWLGVRLDLFSNILVMVSQHVFVVDTELVAVFGIIYRNTVSPSRFGVVLTYTLAAASLFANLVSLYAQVELEMVRHHWVIHANYRTTPKE